MKHLTLTLLLSLFACAGALTAQHTLNGTVTDRRGSALAGATVQAKGAKTGAITDAEGKFSLQLPDETTVLVVSYIGCQTLEMDVAGRQTVGIMLTETAAALNEVVVTGYSEVSAKKLVSSVAVVKSEQMENVPVTDINKLLQGNAAGVYSTANSGQPGSTSIVRIRGAGSVSASRDPLYVIDGVIAISGNGSELETGYSQSELLAQLSPNDIEHVTVLKDASATALYGARGANGVIVITTKRGKAGKTELTARAQTGINIPSFGNLDMMTPKEEWDYERAVLANSGKTPTEIDALRPASLLDNTTDWLDEAFNNGSLYNLEVQARGGNEKTRFFASGSYNDQKGALFGTSFNRLSLRSNIDHYASEKLNFSLNANSSWSKQNSTIDFFSAKSTLMKALTSTTLQGKINPATGQLFTGLEPNWIANQKDNFLYSEPLNPFFNNTFRLISKLSASYRLFEHLQFTQSANLDWITVDETDFDDPTTREGLNTKGYLANAYNKFNTLTTQSMLKYWAEFGGQHSFDALGLVEYQAHRAEHFLAAGKGFASGKLQTMNSAAEVVDVGGYHNQFAFLSFLGQANYGFKGRYMATASLRRDGSSRFGANRRWANFWSLGASWLLTEELFMQRAHFVNLLRLRASYGTSGNAEIGEFPSLELYNFDANYLGAPGSVPFQIGNPELTWEKSNTTNIGLDFSLWDQRVGGTVEWYYREAQDMLFNVPVSATTGFTSVTRNIGIMHNTGVELALHLVPFRAVDPTGFSWETDFNISFNDNKILKLPGGADIITGATIYREGYSIHSIYLPKWAGVNPDDGTPLWEKTDGTLTGKLSEAGKFIVGRSVPDYSAGLTNAFRLRGFSLSVFLYTAQGHSKVELPGIATDSDGLTVLAGYSHIAAAADYWKQPGDIAPRPKPKLGGNNSAHSSSTRHLQDASFIRLRNVTLAYQLPSAWLRRAKVTSVSLYAQGQNLWTLTGFSRLDPEGTDAPAETYRYPVSKALVFGVDIAF